MSAPDGMDFLRELISALEKVRGVAALVLGGSRARGTHHPGSDYDLGLYYEENSPPDRGQLCEVAKGFDDRRQDNLLTAFGEWGPWINGGGWLGSGPLKVDILYRNLSTVRSVIHDCLHGQVSISYQPGHPHGFVSSIYFAEMAHCRPLFDGSGSIAGLKAKTATYPVALKTAIIQKFLWEAQFSLEGARKGIPYLDVSYVAGLFHRTVSCLIQVLFALNERHWMNEKGAVRLASSFPLCPPHFEARINEAHLNLRPKEEFLNQGIGILLALAEETGKLLNG